MDPYNKPIQTGEKAGRAYSAVNLTAVATVPGKTPFFSRSRLPKILVYAIAAVIVLMLATLAFTVFRNNNDGAGLIQNTKSEFSVTTLPPTGLVSSSSLQIDHSQQLSVNGQLQVNGGFVVTPGTQPVKPQSGQIYYDQSSNTIGYYDGTKFRFFADSTSTVTSLGGLTGSIQTGAGLGATGSSLVNTGVLTVQGQSGNVTLLAGDGIAINGRIISSTVAGSNVTQGITSISGTNGLGVTPAGTTVTLSLPQNLTTGATPTFAGLQLNTALGVSSGGTGATSFAAGGLVVGNGAGALGTVTAGGAGQCLLSTAPGNAPVFAACPAGGNISSGTSQTAGRLTKFDATANQITDSLLSEVGTTVTVNGILAVSGAVSGASFSGDGSGLTNVNAATLSGNNAAFYQNASNLNAGTVSDLRLSSNVTLQGNLFNGASQLVQLNASSQLPAVNASLLTALNGSAIASGTISDGRLSSNVALLNGAQTFTNTNTFSNAGNSFTGSGAGLSSLNASNVASGTLAVSFGGTGANSFTTNGLLYGNNTGALLATAAGSTGQCLIAGVGGVPSFQACPVGGNISSGTSQTAGKLTKFDATANQITDSLLSEVAGTVTASGNFTITGTPRLSALSTGILHADASGNVGSSLVNLGTEVTGTLGVGTGGTGQTTYTDGQLLIGNSSGNTLTKATLTAGAGVTIVNGNGSITISAPGAGSCGSCANVTLSNLSSPTAINQSLLTNGGATIDLGSTPSAFRDLYLNNQISILESGATPSFRGSLAVADLSGNQSYTLDQGGTVVTSGNVATYATTGVTAAAGLTGGGGVGALSLSVGAGNGITVNPNDVTLNLQTSKGLEVDASGLSLIDCGNNEILKYSTGTNQWSCQSDAGGSGLGDDIVVNGSAATNANFLDVAASGTVTGTSWSLNTISNPDDITIAISNASATTAGAVTTGAQTFAGAKTFGGQITAGAGVDLAAQTLLGTTAVIDFTNFDVSTAGAVTAVGVDAGTGLLQGNAGLTIAAGTTSITGTANINTSGGAATSVGTGTGNVSLGNATGTLALAGSSASSFVLNGTNVSAAEFNILDGGLDLSTETSGNYVATITAGGGLTGDVSSHGSTPTLAIGAGNGVTVNPNDITLNLQATKGLEVDGSGLSLIDCGNNEILKYSTGTNQWSCQADAGGAGVGDDITVNGTAATNANFLDVAATGMVTGSSWSLNTVSNPDDITISISNASATAAGAVTTGTQTFAGAKTFSSQITAGAGIDLAAQTLLGTAAVIDFTNFDVSSAGAVTAIGVNSGSGLLQGTGGLTITGATSITGTTNINTSGAAATSIGTGTGNLTVGNATGTLALIGSSSSSFVLNGTNVSAAEFNILDGGLDISTETSGNYVATIAAGGGLTGDVSSHGSTPTLAIGAGNGITVNADDITVDATTSGTTATTSSNSGLEATATGLRLLGGCSGTNLILKWNTSTSVWECATDNDSGGTITLQQAYDADVNGGNVTVALTSTDGSLIVQNPASGGIASGSAFKVDQLSTGAVEGLRVESAGTGNLFTVRDTTATATDVFKIADGGATTLQNQTDSAAAFQIQNAAGTATILSADTTKQQLTLTSGTSQVVNEGALNVVTSVDKAGIVVKSIDGAGNGEPLFLALGDRQDDKAFQTKVNSETFGRFSINASGIQEWGSGATARDTNLYRSAVATLKTDDSFIISGGLQPALVATAGTAASASLTVTSAKGGDTSGTTGQVGGAGGAISLTGGDGGDAGGGSTNGGGGGITLQGGGAGAGAGTAGAYGNILLQTSGGNVGIGTATPTNFKLQVAGNIGPNANNSSDLGSSANAFRTGYFATNLQTPSLVSAAATALDIDSGTTGALNIGAGANAKTITVGNVTGTTSLIIQSGTGGISLNPSGSSNTGITVRPTVANSTELFRVRNLADTSNYFVVDGVNSRIGINTSTAPQAALDINTGGLRIAGNLTNFTTPVGSTALTYINIPLADPGGFGQLLALGLPSTANVTSRAISLFDARTVAHQPTLGVFSPDENNLTGFSWDGSNTTSYVKTTGGNIGIRSNATDIATFLSSGNTSLAGDLEVVGADLTTTSTGTATLFNSNAATLNIGGATTAIALGGTTATNVTNIANGTIASGNTGTINIGTNATGTGKTVTTIGSTNDGSSVTLQSGTAGVLVKGANAATAFVVQNASSNNYLAIDTSGASISVGNTGIASSVQIGNTTGAVAQTINIGNNATASSTSTVVVGSNTGTSSTAIQSGTGGINIRPSGASNTGVVVIPTADSSAAFAIQNAVGANLFVADSSGLTIKIGGGEVSADNAPVLLVLDHKTGAGDPTGIEGASYYSEVRNSFRCYQDGIWRDCLYAPRNTLHVYSDFTASSADTVFLNYVLNSGNFSVTDINSVAGHPGILRFRTDATSATSTGGYAFASQAVGAGGSTNPLLLGNNDAYRFESVLRVPTLSTGTQRFTVRSGFIDETQGIDSVDGCYFRYSDTGANANRWEGVCRNNSVETVCDTGITVGASTWYRLGVNVNSAGTAADFNLDGGAVECTINAGGSIPTGAGRGTGYGTGIVKSIGNTDRTLEVDYMEVIGFLSAMR